MHKQGALREFGHYAAMNILAKIDYYVLGHISDELLDELIMIIMILAKSNKLRNNLNNIKEAVVN